MSHYARDAAINCEPLSMHARRVHLAARHAASLDRCQRLGSGGHCAVVVLLPFILLHAWPLVRVVHLVGRHVRESHPLREYMRYKASPPAPSSRCKPPLTRPPASPASLIRAQSYRLALTAHDSTLLSSATWTSMKEPHRSCAK